MEVERAESETIILPAKFIYHFEQKIEDFLQYSRYSSDAPTVTDILANCLQYHGYSLVKVEE